MKMETRRDARRMSRLHFTLSQDKSIRGRLKDVVGDYRLPHLICTTNYPRSAHHYFTISPCTSFPEAEYPGHDIANAPVPGPPAVAVAVKFTVEPSCSVPVPKT